MRSEELIACERNVRKVRLPVLLEVPGEVHAGELLIAGAQQHQVEGVEVAVTWLLLHHAGLLQQVVVDVSANWVACHRREMLACQRQKKEDKRSSLRAAVFSSSNGLPVLTDFKELMIFVDCDYSITVLGSPNILYSESNLLTGIQNFLHPPVHL